MSFDRPGGNITRVIELYSGLEKRGHNLKILLPQGMDAKYARSLQNVFTYNSPYLENSTLNYLAGQFFHHYLFNKFDFLNDADIIHADLSLLFPLSRLAKLERRGNVVFDLHSVIALDLEPFIPSFFRVALLPALNWAQGRLVKKGHTIAVSYSMKKYLEKVHGVSSRIHVIHPGTNLSYAKEMSGRYFEKYRWMKENSDIVFTYVGTFLPSEGLLDLIRAMKRITRKIKNARLVLIGGGPQEAKLKMLAKSLELEKNIIFHKWIPYDETFSAQAQADVLVCTTKSPCKGSIISSIAFPVKIPHYLTAGKPILASRVGDVPIAIRDGHEGILLENSNPETIAKSLLKLASSDKLREEYGNNSRRRAELFSWERALDKLELVYEKILESSA
jgi:glycosyltransferase involved in cell wall biosynthesis